MHKIIIRKSAVGGGGGGGGGAWREATSSCYHKEKAHYWHVLNVFSSLYEVIKFLPPPYTLPTLPPANNTTPQ